MMRITLSSSLLLGVVAFSTVGCKYMQRDPDQYRNDTRAVLEKNAGTLKSCFDGVIKNDPSAGGSVVVQFIVQPETGVIEKVKIDEANSVAPKPVQDCVASSLVGLKLDPPDALEGQASFTYEFEVAPQAPAPQPSEFKTDG